jgi:amino acid transporter
LDRGAENAVNGVLKRRKVFILSGWYGVARMFENIRQLAADEKAQADTLQATLIALVTAATVGFVGLQVMSTVIDATALNSGDTLYNASEELAAAVNDAFGLIGVTFLVIILSTIIFYLRGVR